MKRLIFISFIAFSITLIFACSKEDALDPSAQKTDGPKPPDTSIVFGDVTQMRVFTHKFAIRLWSSPELDLNSDGVHDIGISYYLNRGSNGDSPVVELTCLHNDLEIFMNSKIDSQFRRTIDTTFIFDSKYRHHSGTTYYCDYQPGSSFFRVLGRRTEVKSSNSGNSYSTNDMHASGKFILFKEQVQESIKWTHDDGDTSYYSLSYNNWDCRNYPNGESYLGFKIRDSVVDRLGWIKFEDGPFIINEIAIQK